MDRILLAAVAAWIVPACTDEAPLCDCPEGTVCRAGVCERLCNIDDNCLDGMICLAGVCAAGHRAGDDVPPRDGGDHAHGDPSAGDPSGDPGGDPGGPGGDPSGDPGGDPGGGDPSAGDPVLDASACDDVLADALFCDGFETGDLSRWSSSEEPNSVVNDPVVRGAWAFEPRYSGSGDSGGVIDVVPMSVASGMMSVRVYLRVPATLDIEGDTAVLSTGEYRAEYAGAAIELAAPNGLAVVDTIGGTTFYAPYVLPRDQWICVRLEIDVADSGGALRLFADEVLILEETGRDTLPDAGYQFLNLGIAAVEPAQGPAAYVLDEFAAATRRIPCD